MKYFFSFFFLSIVIALSAQSELPNDSKFYVTFKGGFSIPASKSTIGSPRAEIGRDIAFIRGNNGSITDQSFTAPFNSRGAGATVGAAFGYMINENFGVEMEFSFVRSTEILNASRDIDTTGARFFAEHTSHTKMLRMAPMLVVSGNKSMKIRPYAKFGLILPFVGGTFSTINFDDKTGVLSESLLPIISPDVYQGLLNIREQNELFRNLPIPTRSSINATTLGNFSVGFASRFGADFKINNKISLFAELEVNMLTIKARKSTITKFRSEISDQLIINIASGEDFFGPDFKYIYTLEDLPEIIRVTNYVNEITENSNYSYDTNSSSFNKNKPYDQLTFRDNYNSFGLMIGIKYNF
jgi:opacity protein-like surface antigen